MLKNPHQAVSSHEYFVEYSLCKVWSRWFRIPRSADLQEDCQILLGGRHSVATIVFPRRRVCDDPSPRHHVTGHQFTHMVLESLINGISIAKPRCQPLTTNIGAEADRHPEPVRIPYHDIRTGLVYSAQPFNRSRVGRGTKILVSQYCPNRKAWCSRLFVHLIEDRCDVPLCMCRVNLTR